MRLRSHLVALILAALVPVLGFTPAGRGSDRGALRPGRHLT
jgi:hypothetical protein